MLRVIILKFNSYIQFLKNCFMKVNLCLYNIITFVVTAILSNQYSSSSSRRRTFDGIVRLISFIYQI